MNTDYDLIIVGGGLVGVTLLRALGDLGIKIALIEAKSSPINAIESNINIEFFAPLDQRSLVLSLGSKLFYEDLGIWQKIAPYTTDIKKIIISEQGAFSKIFLDKSDLAVPALGYVINIDLLYQTIWNNIKIKDNCSIFSPYSVKTLTVNKDGVALELSGEEQNLTLNGKMIIGADGGRSYIRDLANISYDQHDYQQIALITNVEHELENNNVAYERFSAAGPFALLPRANTKKVSGIVWPWPVADADKLKKLTDQELITKLQKLFGYKLGKFLTLGNKQFFPLWRINSKTLFKNRIILLGNAANNIHPIGGQGFNLGVRDIKTFATLVNNYKNALVDKKFDLDLITQIYLKYYNTRKFDHDNLLMSTHGLLTLFGADNKLVKSFRKFGMNVVNNSYILRNYIADKSMGLQMEVI